MINLKRLNICVFRDPREWEIEKTFEEMTKHFINTTKTIIPVIYKRKKHEENYTKTHESNCLKQVIRKNHKSTRENKDTLHTKK